MDGLSSLKIDKLRDNNFHVWKQKIELVLSFRDLSDHIVEGAAAPREEEKAAEWSRNDSKARAVIGLTIPDEYLEMVRDCDTVLEMCMSIQNIFRRSTLLNQLHARRKFYSAKMGNGERVLSYISRVRQLASDVKSMGVIVNAQDVAMTLLSGLPKRYEHLIVAIDTVTDAANIDIDFVKSRLIQEEQRIADREDDSPGSSQAALYHQQKAAPRGKKFCNYCKKANHSEPYCWKKHGDERGNQKGLISEGGKPSLHDRDDLAYCLMASAEEERGIPELQWVIDLGATSHMTFDQNEFDNLEKTSSFGVGMGNQSTVRAEGKGNIKVRLDVDSEDIDSEIRNVLYVPTLNYSLLSVSEMDRTGMRISFETERCEISKGGVILARRVLQGGLYVLKTSRRSPQEPPSQKAIVADLST